MTQTARHRVRTWPVAHSVTTAADDGVTPDEATDATATDETDQVDPPALTDGYSVGYAKPPRRSQFQPGQSGNPKGRRKAARGTQAIIEAELNSRVSITEGGRRRTITKRELVGKQLVKKAIEGDPKALAAILKVESAKTQTGEAVTEADVASTAELDAMALDLFLATFPDARAQAARDVLAPQGTENKKAKDHD